MTRKSAQLLLYLRHIVVIGRRNEHVGGAMGCVAIGENRWRCFEVVTKI